LNVERDEEDETLVVIFEEEKSKGMLPVMITLVGRGSRCQSRSEWEGRE